MGKSTISMAIFNSFLYVYQRVHPLDPQVPKNLTVLPVPGAPAISKARPAIFFDLMRSTVMPHASRAFSCLPRIKGFAKLKYNNGNGSKPYPPGEHQNSW